MTASIAVTTTPRKMMAVTPNKQHLHKNMPQQRAITTEPQQIPTNFDSMMVPRTRHEEDLESHDNLLNESTHAVRRDGVVVEVNESVGARVQQSSLLRYPSSEMGKLLFGAGGIYFSFLYYGSLQEDVFRFKGDDGQKFVYAWWLQFLEASANIIVGGVGQQQQQQNQQQHDASTHKTLPPSSANSVASTTANSSNGHVLATTMNNHHLMGTRRERLPLLPFFASGASQVISKACTSLALAHGLSFPVATLAKSGKMAPVMIGQLVMGGSHYSVRDYLQVLAIVGGTALLGLGKNSHHDNASEESHSTWLGAFFILSSLAMDGVTAGLQKRLQADLARRGITAHPYDFMLYTNISMMIVALLIGLHEFRAAWSFCWQNPTVWTLVLSFSICSAIGQSFIFYTVAHFDPLVCSTITTSRKMASVLFSIFAKGHELPHLCWIGITLAFGGIVSEVQAKMAQRRKIKSAT